MNLALTFFGALLGCIAGIAIVNWIRAELDERAWRRILEEETGENVPMYRLVATDSKDSDRE